MPADVRYTLSDGLHIAFRISGQGPTDLVLCEPSLASFDHLSDFPPWARFVDRLGEFARVITFDRRGTGLSDRPSLPDAMALEARVDDLGAVLDAAGSQRAVVLGVVGGTWAAAMFAASHPDRVSALILHHPIACGRVSADYPWANSPDALAQDEELVRQSWGTRGWAERDLGDVASSLAADTEMLDRWTAVARRSATFGEELERIRRDSHFDVRSLLPAIRVPTLVIHRAGDPGPSRYVANRISGAELLELNGKELAPFAGDPDEVPQAIKTFLERLETDVEPDRILATVLFVDIVSSTEHARGLGDRRWRQLIANHQALIRGQLARFRGREIDTAGDGFLASFDGPARALRCACRIRDATQQLGVEVRAGLHTGECELADGKLVGVAVHTAARVAGEADPSEVLVSSTVKELVAGSSLEFTDRGVHNLRGVDDWHLYAVHEDVNASEPAAATT